MGHRKTIRRKGGSTPRDKPRNPPHYNVFSDSALPIDSDVYILNRICDVLDAHNKTHKSRIKKIRELVKQRKSVYGVEPKVLTYGEDVSPTSGQEQLANVSQTS